MPYNPLLGGCGTRAPHPALRGQGFRNPATSIVYKPAKLRYNKRYNILTKAGPHHAHPVSYTHLCVQVIGRTFVLFKQKKKESAYAAVLAK